MQCYDRGGKCGSVDARERSSGDENDEVYWGNKVAQ